MEESSSSTGSMGERILHQLQVLSGRVDMLAGIAGDGRRTTIPRPEEQLKAAAAPDVQETNLQKPGNKEQFAFCRRIRALATGGLACFDDEGHFRVEGVERALFTALSLTMEQVREREKLIRIADRSQLGWQVVQQYTADPIAENCRKFRG